MLIICSSCIIHRNGQGQQLARSLMHRSVQSILTFEPNSTRQAVDTCSEQVSLAIQAISRCSSSPPCISCIANLLRRRWPSAPCTSVALGKLRPSRVGLFPSGVRLGFVLIVDISVDPDLVAEVLYACLACVKLCRVLPSVGDSGSGTRLVARGFERNVLREQ